MSAQYDVVYANELTDLRQDQWEYLMTRNRNGVLPWQFMFGDCNPQHPKHWVKQMLDRGWIGSPENQILHIQGHFQDNPRWWDRESQEWTPEGYDFIFVKLNALTGSRRARLLEGKWAAAEGQIYDTFNRGVHIVKHFEPPSSWRRIWAFDFGFVNPFVWGNIVIDPDGNAYLYQQLYHSHLLVEDICKMIWNAVLGQPYPQALICDHDAEGRATLERYFGMTTLPAYKDVAEGIQNVQTRLGLVYDGTQRNMEGVDIGRPRFAVMEGSLVHSPDPLLVNASKPTRTEDEFEGYVWDQKAANEKQRGDIPVKLDDHGMDMVRYALAFEDSLGSDPSEEEMTVPFGLEYGVRISPF
jgi:phage terminase large subunit